MPTRKPSLPQRMLDLSPRKVATGASQLLYRITRQHALAEVSKEVGARRRTVEAIVEAEFKGYEELGGTEIAALSRTEFANQPQQNLEILANLYRTHPWVKVCTSYIANGLAGIPLRVYRATGFEDGEEVLDMADDSPVGKMFRWVNPHQSPYQFVDALTSWILLTGEGYVAFTDRTPGLSPSGVPAEMYVLHTPFVEKVTSPGRGLIGYRYSVSGEVAYFDARDVAAVQTWSPAGRFRGEGNVAAGIKTIATDEELREFNRNVLNQGVHLSGVLETDNEDLNQEAAETVRKSFERQYAGSAKAAKLAVLWGGLRFSPQTILQKDVMMSEQIDRNRDEIIALFGLKPELLTEKFANKATAETVRRMAYEDTILGRWGKLIESVFSSTGLIKFDPDLRVRFDTRAVPALQISVGEKVETASAAVTGGLITINEARQSILGMEPVDGIEGEILLLNGQPLASVAGGDSGKPSPESSMARRLASKKASFSTVSIKATADEIAWHRSRDAAEARTERAIRAVLRDMQKEIRNQVTRSEVHSQMLAKVEQIFAFEGRNAMVVDSSASLRRAIDDAVEQELGRLAQAGITSAFDVKPVRALARLNSQEQRIRNMMGRNWTDLRGSLGEGLANGETTAELRARTEKFFDGMRNNAATIARTEVTAAVNAATNDVALAAKAEGIDVVSQWITFQDALVRTRPDSDFDHAQAHGLTIVPGEELFRVSGEKLEYPGDSWNGASPGNTINCRCGILTKVRGLNDGDNRGE